MKVSWKINWPEQIRFGATVPLAVVIDDLHICVLDWEFFETEMIECLNAVDAYHYNQSIWVEKLKDKLHFSFKMITWIIFISSLWIQWIII